MSCLDFSISVIKSPFQSPEFFSNGYLILSVKLLPYAYIKLVQLSLLAPGSYHLMGWRVRYRWTSLIAPNLCGYDGTADWPWLPPPHHPHLCSPCPGTGELCPCWWGHRLASLAVTPVPGSLSLTEPGHAEEKSLKNKFLLFWLCRKLQPNLPRDSLDFSEQSTGDVRNIRFIQTPTAGKHASYEIWY